MKLFKRGLKTAPVISAERVATDLLMRHSFAQALTPRQLTRQWDQFAAGYLSEFALTAAAIEERDDMLPSLCPKRRKSVSRLEWEIVCYDESPEALRQKDIVESFYSTLTATSAVDEDDEGGINLLIRYMLESVGLKWAVQEIVWKPSPAGLSAEFRKVPLWFFEHTKSRLRYLPVLGAVEGLPMEPGEWLVTRGDGLMIPSTAMYLLKHLPLRDWLLYSRRYVVPGLHGKTDAKKGTSEWNDFLTALGSFDMNFHLLTDKMADIDVLDVSARGELPYPKLVEYANRAMTVLWRGSDLSTMSSTSGQGTGASVQGEESDILVEDDIVIVNETLKRKVTPFVLAYTLGAVETLVEFKLIAPSNDNVEQELKIDDYLVKWGCPVGKADLLERYKRPQPDAGEELASAPVAPSPFGVGAPGARPEPAEGHLVNAVAAAALGDRKSAQQLIASARLALAPAVAQDLQPVLRALSQVIALPDADMLPALRKVRADLPDLLRRIAAKPAAAKVIEETTAAAILNGYAEGKDRRS